MGFAEAASVGELVADQALRVAAVVVVCAACGPERQETGTSTNTSTSTATSTTGAWTSTSPSTSPSTGTGTSTRTSTGACPADMRLVEGGLCPHVEQVCLGWNEVNVAGVVERNQCKTYREPAV